MGLRIRQVAARTIGLRLLITAVGLWFSPSSQSAEPTTLPGTQPLTTTGDLADTMVAGVDRFLLDQTAKSSAIRERSWNRDFRSASAYAAGLERNRQRLAHILGVRDARVTSTVPQLIGTLGRPDLLATCRRYNVFAIRWPAFGDVTGAGLLLEPGDGLGIADVVVVPDADQLPEQLVGLVPGLAAECQTARRLAESGCRVIVPTLIDRAVMPRNGRARLTNREFIQRPAYELGRTIIGYEVQKVLALVDWLSKRAGSDERARIGVCGYGEGGGIALYAAALDRRIDAACVSGYFDDRDTLWTQPVDRNVFGLLDQFGDAELATLAAPRTVVIEAAKGPEFLYAADQGGAPGKIVSPQLQTVKNEVNRARRLIAGLHGSETMIRLVTSGSEGTGPPGTDAALNALLAALHPNAKLRQTEPDDPLQAWGSINKESLEMRQADQLHELDRHNQQLLGESSYTRQKFMARLDTSSPDSYARTIEPYREFFATQVVGRFELQPLPPNVRTRKLFDQPGYTGYEVVMDVFPDVFAFGILLVPKGITNGERRPVVVCQHGLEGRPGNLADPSVHHPGYNQVAIRLAERGFITFAPQNLYLFGDRFRTLQRKANPLGKTLFSVIVPQHQQIANWLKTLPQVDPARIAFYGLSYGGKSAMRIPPLVKDYCLSICSADFNDWVWKNASSRSPYSYVWSEEYEIFEFDLGSTFNYAEMAALIAPRPFMVERGHFDGVAPDETVAYEFAKVYNLYHARLGLGDRCKIEFFVGPHAIHGVGTFQFLDAHLNWTARKGDLQKIGKAGNETAK